jgi:hypothetical protein
MASSAPDKGAELSHANNPSDKSVPSTDTVPAEPGDVDDGILSPSPTNDEEDSQPNFHEDDSPIAATSPEELVPIHTLLDELYSEVPPKSRHHPTFIAGVQFMYGYPEAKPLIDQRRLSRANVHHTRRSTVSYPIPERDLFHFPEPLVSVLILCFVLIFKFIVIDRKFGGNPAFFLEFRGFQSYFSCSNCLTLLLLAIPEFFLLYFMPSLLLFLFLLLMMRSLISKFLA